MKLGRIATITRVFVEEGLGFLTEDARSDDEGQAPEGGDEAARPPRSEFGQRLRQTLERLGPSFVKFGQMLGTRVDLFDEEFLAELGKLHSSVSPFPSEEAYAILEAELGAPANELFAELSAEPIAAASIAQVYKGRLPGPDGAWVAVKVQRPNLEESLLSDLEVLVEISGWIDTLVPHYRRAMVHKLAEEYAHRARLEIDFLAEARAIEEFADVIATLPEFRAPEVYRELCTAKVLVMEWFEGTKLDSIKTAEELAACGFEPSAFSRSMFRLQLSMSYEHGIVHGDTHPGNIILLPSGQIGLIDFGLNARIPLGLREKMLETVFYQVSGRVDEAASAFLTVLDPDPSVDRAALEADLRSALAVNMDPEGSLGENRFTEQIIGGLRIGARYRIKARSELFMVMRNLAIVEGIALRFSPELPVVKVAKEIAGEILRRKLFGPSMQEQVMQLLPQLILTLSKRPQLIDRLLRLERSFVDAKNFGGFLRSEGVLAERGPRTPETKLSLVLAALLGVALGFALHALAR